MTADVARAWAEQRPRFRGLHVDSAAAGRCSVETTRAVCDHLVREAETGAYVAEADAQPVLAAGREALAGLLGTRPDELAFVESATAALAALLRAWPLRSGHTVAVVPSEWGPTLATFADRGLRVVELPVGADGVLDLDRLGPALAADRPSLVHLTQVASHRPLVQPVAEAATRCRVAGVPLWVDAAQALGHVDTATGADAVYATSRKWLTGPRGVGLLAVAEPWWSRLHVPATPMDPPGWSPVRALESREANVAGRVGLAAAARQHVEAGPERIRQRLADVGVATREALADLPGWDLVEPAGDVAITALRPTGGQDVGAVRDRLLAEHGVVATCAEPARAPREMTGPLLRMSPHVDCSDDDLHRLRSALR